jgi:preprotein translocase SecE subunit
VARTRKQPTKRTRKVPKIKKPTFFGKIFGPIGRFIKKIFRPFRFILRPFKTKPIRAIGRFLKKVLLINYFISAWREVRQVTWPNRKETANLTFAVFIFAIAFGVLIAIIDFGLDKLFREVLL